MSIIAIIQARYKSSRLQGKVLLNLGNMSVLGNVIRRLYKCKELDGIVVATRAEPENNLIIQEAIKHGAQYYTGRDSDVLERYYRCARFYKADRIVRITSDCPFIMPDLVDRLIVESGQADYASNVIKRTYPKGFDCEIFNYNMLEEAYRNTLGDDRQHVTPYMIQNSNTKHSLEDNEDYSHKRVTLDTPEDYIELQEYYKTIGNIYNYNEVKSLWK